jgi:hypothetical protein
MPPLNESNQEPASEKGLSPGCSLDPLVRVADYFAKWITSGLPTIWTRLREAARGRSERAAIQGNRAS